ncbi:hypothetical protein RSOLAG1IB_01496 [Rhizoctonia solani AG-1 IB]|uniref:Uncharacterized protein n=1 Tax=Thanatephorus cucumeris (strain AG1-IB / isolate 7/3/14) TaxID=1108050 RepID=A0A0B7FEZ7_THACB|nr:hypothetical protein RSOLAG1IB_01496 [Rhizoctonia solani AG-1 IB]
MSSGDNCDPYDPDFPCSRGRADPGVATRHLIYPPGTRVQIRTNGLQYEATVVKLEVESGRYIVRDDHRNDVYVPHSDVTHAIIPPHE